MAINLVYGVPGGGKSYYTVYKYVLESLKAGRKVITNLPLNIPYLTEILGFPKELIEVRLGKSGSPYDAFETAEDMKDDWRNEKNQAPIVIIDEAHFCLPKDKKRNEVNEIRNFFSTHRQDGYDIILITQYDKAMPREILGMVEYFYRLQKKQMFKIKLFGKELFGNRYTVTIFDQMRKEVGSKVETYQKKVFKCYNSHLLSKGEVMETDASKGVGSIWLKPQMLMAYLFIAFVFYKFTLGGLEMNMNELKSSSHLKENVDLDNLEIVDVKTGEVIEKITDEVKVEEVQDLKKVETVSPKFEYLAQTHPLENKQFQIRSWINDVGFIALFDKDTKEMVSKIKTTDLQKMGYVVEKYSDCSMSLSYNDLKFFIDCSSLKKEEKKIGTESFVSKFAES